MSTAKVTRRKITAADKLAEIAAVRAKYVEAIKRLDERADSIRAEAREQARMLLEQVGE